MPERTSLAALGLAIFGPLIGRAKDISFGSVSYIVGLRFGHTADGRVQQSDSRSLRLFCSTEQNGR